MKKIIFFIPVAFLIAPSFALASWWNPFTWDIFNHSNTVPVVTQPVSNQNSGQDAGQASATPEVVKQIITKATSTVSTVATVKNCGKDVQCLIAVAPTCGPANVSWTFTVDFMGKSLTPTDNISISKNSSGKCSLTVTTTDIKLDNKPAPPEVQQGFMHMKKLCTYTPSDLKKVLINWSVGNISNFDDDLGNCKSINI
jgi:hypothetical protein